MEKKQHPVATAGVPLFKMLKFSVALLLKHIIFSINRTAVPRPGSIFDDIRSFYHHKFVPLNTCNPKYKVPNLEYTYSALYHKEENHYQFLNSTMKAQQQLCFML